MKKEINIAVLLTCFNRCAKTVSCLQHLFDAQKEYNAQSEDMQILLSVFLTDDGCTDGTADAVRAVCCTTELYIVKGNGSLYWAGGMRAAWSEAMKQSNRWQYYLLLNDDTDVHTNVFDNLFQCHSYSMEVNACPGIYSGITSSRTNPEHVSYGGDVYLSSSKTLTRRLSPVGVPQRADIVTANILLVPQEVVAAIGIFYKGYIHSGADNDYSVMARKSGFLSYVTPEICGQCDDDHSYDKEECLRLMKMSFKERYNYVNSPTRSDKDYLLLMRRTIPKKFPISWLMRKLRLFCPSFYYKLNKLRGYYV